MTATTNGTAPAAPARRPNIRKNGDYAVSQAWGDVYQAAAHEEAIAAEAAAIWAEYGPGAQMDRAIFQRLYPLLRRPIHAGHIIATTAAKGKPYESDGVRSAQVLIDRMNIVLTPMWWRMARQYEDDGKLCLVTVRVFDGDGQVLAEGQSYGGMDRANTAGNLRKASFTNAAKLAFAAIGPGHEVYAGAIDYDPDLLPGAIEDQNRAPAVAREKPTTAVATDRSSTPEKTPEQRLEEILAIEDDLAGLRHDINKGMELAGATIRQRARDIDQRLLDRQALEAFKAAVNNAVTAAAE